MASGMHENEVPVPDELVRRLVDTQFPEWRALPIRRLPPIGTDHQLFRLGDEFLVRMPRIDWAVGQAHSDWTWLPRLAPYLPLTVPAPVALGEPGEGYPWAWTVVRWIPGESPAPGSVGSAGVARDLGMFVTALRRVDTAGAPVRTDRGAPLALRDEIVREDLEALGDRVDQVAVLSVWEDALTAPVWDGPPVWLHGDLKTGNLLVRDGRLRGVIDWGGLGVGDPALDLTAAWLSLRPEVRSLFRAAAGLDGDAWRRGRGWALTISLRELPYYWDRSPTIAEGARRAIAAVLDEFG